MKGQTEIIVFVLLFLIGTILFVSAVGWSRGIFGQNVDIAKIQAAENFMINFNKKINDIIKFGGKESIDYNLDSLIELVGTNIIEVRFSVNAQVPKYWINVTVNENYIREKLEGNLFKIQIRYSSESPRIEFFTNGPKLATPKKIIIEKAGSYNDNNITVVRLNVTFE